VSFKRTNYVHITTMQQALQEWEIDNRYYIDGMWMSLSQFANYIYPTDCAEKTHLILRLQERKDAI
jgi:hypothetical protein